MPGEEKPERPEPGRRAEALFREFRESRLFVQVVLSLGLVVLAWAVTVMPAQAGARARAGLTWAATHDYDFAGQWQRANRWAGERGGWYTAVTGEWNVGLAKLRTWSQSLVPPGLRGAAPAPFLPAGAGVQRGNSP